MFKLPKFWMFQTSTKSLPNLKWFFCQNLENSRHVRTGCFLYKFCFYSNLCQTSKYSNILHRCSYEATNPDNSSAGVIFPWTFVRETESQNVNRAISVVQFSPKYPSTCWKWEVGMNPEWFGWKRIMAQIKRGPSKSPPNSFQIGNLEGDIWTFQQIDQLRQSPIYIESVQKHWRVRHAHRMFSEKFSYNHSGDHRILTEYLRNLPYSPDVF